MLIGEDDLGDVEAPAEVTVLEELEPGVRTAFDELLLRRGHRIERAAVGGGGACLDFDKEKGVVVSRNDIDFAALGVLEVAGEDFVTGGLEVAGGNFFAKLSNFLRAYFFSSEEGYFNGCIERPA